MKKLIYLVLATGLIAFTSCESKKERGDRDRATATDNILNDPREDINEENTPDLDDGEGSQNQVMEGIPSQVKEKINKDASDKNRKILNSRPVPYSGEQVYVVTFLEQNGNQTKVTYDEKGDEVEGIE